MRVVSNCTNEYKNGSAIAIAHHTVGIKSRKKTNNANNKAYSTQNNNITI
jgi:hypothetical protein